MAIKRFNRFFGIRSAIRPLKNLEGIVKKTIIAIYIFRRKIQTMVLFYMPPNDALRSDIG
jgi:hypothetical protein